LHLGLFCPAIQREQTSDPFLGHDSSGTILRGYISVWMININGVNIVLIVCGFMNSNPVQRKEHHVFLCIAVLLQLCIR